MPTTQSQMGNGLDVKVDNVSPWELARVQFRLYNGSNVKYAVTDIDDYEAANY